MHDVQLEQRLRRALHEEAAEHRLTVTIDQVEQRLRTRRRQRGFNQFGLLAAAAAFVVLVAGGALLSGRLAPSSGVAVTPSPTIAPSASVAPTASPAPSAVEPLPSLVAAGGEFQVLLDWPSGETGGLPGSVETPLGVIWPAERYRVSVVCRGPGNLDYALGGTIEEPTVGGAQEECDGRSPQVIEFSGVPADAILLQPLVVADGSTVWNILIEGAGVRSPWPAMTASGPDGALVEGGMGCGMSYELAIGLSGADQCGGPEWPPIPDAVLSVRVGEETTFAMPEGWRMDSPSLLAAPADKVVQLIEPVTANEIARIDGPTDHVTVVFGEPGSFVVRADSRYERGGDWFSAPYFFRVTVMPTD